MPAAVPNGQELCQPPLAAVHRFSVDEYHRMIQAGVLTENHRVELLEGWIVSKTGHHPPHDSMIDLIVGALGGFLPLDWFMRVQSAITTDDSEPEPDVAVVRGPRGRYLQQHPRPADIGLLIEVADTTLLHDRGDKAPLYARAWIGTYWIINVIEKQVEVFTDPSGPDAMPEYRQRRIHGPDDAVPVIFDGKEVGRILVKTLFAD